jgi:hypothetical protein
MNSRVIWSNGISGQDHQLLKKLKTIKMSDNVAHALAGNF